MLFFKKDIQLWNLQKCDDDIQNDKKNFPTILMILI